MHDERVVLPISQMSREFLVAVVRALPECWEESRREKPSEEQMSSLALKLQIEKHAGVDVLLLP